jgi:hypothetical protein
MHDANKALQYMHETVLTQLLILVDESCIIIGCQTDQEHGAKPCLQLVNM